ncbi:MAG: hypothetical protein WCJ30_04045 [Deltaproteobacteria bacterium]
MRPTHGLSKRLHTRTATIALVAAALAGCAADGVGDIGSTLSETRVGRCPIASQDPECLNDGGGPGGGDDGGRGGDHDGGWRRGNDGGTGAQDGGSGGDQDGGSRGNDGGSACANETAQSCRGNCNSSDGSDTAACLAEGNTGGCTDEMFQGWCRRRVGDGSTWPLAVRGWVEARCAGEITIRTDSGGYEWLVCHDTTTCTEYRCSTPLVLVFDTRRGVVYRADDGRSEFDLAAVGEAPATRTDWPDAATPWLVLDRDGDGRITSGRELFGSAVVVDGRPARDGFEALSGIDANRDGVIDARDPMFGSLRAWSDRNHDRVSTPDEMRPLAAYGIKSLPVGHTIAARCDARGNCERERAALTWRDAQGVAHAGAVVDVHLAVR